MPYCKTPTFAIHGAEGMVFSGVRQIVEELRARCLPRAASGRVVLTFETYPGVTPAQLAPLLTAVGAARVFSAEDALVSRAALAERLAPTLTDDRVFGRMFYGELSDFRDAAALSALRAAIGQARGLVVVYGAGASEIVPADVLVYADITRWEIQLRYRRGAANFHADNGREETLRKFKRGYFFDWRVADKLKRRCLPRADYYLDCAREDTLTMITGELCLRSLRELSARPFRMVPYFDPGIWGGHWMQERFELDKAAPNFAWSFDGVPEENSLLFSYGEAVLAMPAINLVFFRPVALLGEGVFARYGAEFPIRFDLLDTMGGGSLSLQVHPLTDFIHNRYGMSYTQDESYYLLDAEEGAGVYLGVKDGVSPDAMADALRAGQRGEGFDDGAFVNRFPARKGDHFLIPAGTVHGAGSGTMVLEISATPYIFTFKLWDWGRVNADGKPRPIHIDEGLQNIQWPRGTAWARANLVNRTERLADCAAYTEERTGLHALEAIETRRYVLRGRCPLDTCGTVNVLNLVDGESALVESPAGAFPPYEVHAYETFIVPAAVGAYTITPTGAGGATLMRAFIRP